MKKKLTRTKIFIRRLRHFFTTTVLGGVLVMLPLALFVIVVGFLFNFVTNFVSPIGKLFNFSPNVNEWIIDLISLALVIALSFMVGLFVRTTSGRQILNYFEEHWLRHLPLYSTLRDTVQAFFGTEKMPFSKVVLIDVYGSGVLMTGFVTDEHKSGMYTVFVPTGPNPTNGFIFHAKKDKLVFVDVKPEDAMRSIVGVGVGSSMLFPNGKPVSLIES